MLIEDKAEIEYIAPITLKRRSFLFSSALLVGMSLLDCSSRNESPVNQIPSPKPQENFYPTVPLTEFNLDFRNPNTTERVNSSELDPNYLGQLIEILQRNQSTKEERARYVSSNLSWFITNNGVGTALKIDASGYFVTAAHLFYDMRGKLLNEYSLVYDTSSKNITPVKNFIALEDPFKDVAVFYSPSGQPRRPLGGLALDFTEPENNEQLWMHALLLKPPTFGRRYIYQTQNN